MIDAPQPIQVLVVDDEPSTRLLLRRWIERSLDAEVEEAPDGLKALEEIAKGKTELIVTDLNMPVLSGPDMLTLLQADPRRRDLEVLVATQVAGEQAVRQAIQLGVSDYLLKPLQYDWVVERLKRATERILERRAENEQKSMASGAPVVLIADPDPNFCETAEAALFGRYTAVTARSVAQVLVSALRYKPTVILISSAIPGLNMEFLLERIRGLPGDCQPDVYQLLEPGQADGHPDVTGTVAKTFVPEKLRKSISGLFGDAGEGSRVQTWTDSVAPELITAIYQAFGMMTGEEPEATKDPPPEEHEVYGTIHLHAAGDDDLEITLQLNCPKALDKALLGAMLGEEPEEDDGTYPAMGEMLNVVAGRIKNSCEERKMSVQLGLPETSGEKSSDYEDREKMERLFIWREHLLFARLSTNRAIETG